jgi:hypothetical protein
MSTLALPHIDTGPWPAATVKASMRRHRGLIVGYALLFPIGFYLLLLAMLVVRYGDLPNYITSYNWPANIWRIVESTGSLADIVVIAADEWLIEIGVMNYDYGNGIADWSLSVLPHKLVILMLAGALIGLNVAVLLDLTAPATPGLQALQAGAGLLASFGALGASVTNATVFSVVHCATPSWVGSFAVLGLDQYDLFPIEPYGPLICTAGLVALIVSAMLIVASDCTALPTTRSFPAR